MTAENYHLKWDSHLSYLNSSIATLYKNEKYADVILYSSNTTGSVTNAMPTVGISAHKFILSSCSQFFSAIFETSPITNSGIFYIVLPPDLSHRAIQILVQYMYVGEATVSNDILSEVLRGGEILKIRGLCRTSANASNSANQQQSHLNRNIDNQQTNSSSSYNLTRMPMNSGPTSVRYLMEQQQQQHSRGLGASVMPKDSPVIIKSPKPLSTLASSTAGISKPTSSGITINKQVAIDPGDKCCYSQQESLPANSSVDEASTSICNEIGCNSCPRIAENLQPMILRRERSQSDDPTVLCRKSCLERCDETNYLRNASNDCGDEIEEDDSSRLYEHEMRRCSLPAERSDVIHEYVSDNYANRLSHIAHSKHGIIRENVVGTHNTATASGACEEANLTSPIPNQEPSAGFVSIKEEPTDWLPSSSSSSSLTQQNSVESSSKVINKIENFQTTHIKMESSPPSSSIHHMENDCRPLLASSSSVLQPPIANDFERYFSCDICSKTCEDKATLIRHLETHTATPCSSGFNPAVNAETPTPSKSYVPKKRRRTSQQENTTDHVCLQCDICSMRFETPAEWVRHMNSQHTEVELAMFNSKKDKEKNNSASSNNNHKKPNSSRQPHQLQPQHPRTQVLNGSTNSNLSNSTSVLCTSPNQTRHDASSDYLRSTLSPA